MRHGPVVRSLAIVVVAITLAVTAQAENRFKTLYRFREFQTDGGIPTGALVMDANGNLYGTTIYGGYFYQPFETTCGTVFELSPTKARRGGWEKKTLYKFTGEADGCIPTGSIVLDASGKLYGTAQFGAVAGCPTSFFGSGDVQGCGTVFELSPADGGWTESTIYSFSPKRDAFGPRGLSQDASGNLYGVARRVDDNGAEMVYELSPVGGGVWAEKGLRTFDYSDGLFLNSPLLLDSSGNLFGTATEGGKASGDCTTFGGDGGCGTVFELSPTGGGAWSIDKFALPNTNQGYSPVGSLVEDSMGDLFGAASAGGPEPGGVVFKLLRITGGGWVDSVIHIFGTASGNKGFSPTSLISDGSGGFYGTTRAGGNTGCVVGCGVVFHLTPTAQGGWAETVLHRFTGGYDDSAPNALIRDAFGNLYGTTTGPASAFTSCTLGCGTVFEIVAPDASAK
jgi:hypothetical protein